MNIVAAFFSTLDRILKAAIIGISLVMIGAAFFQVISREFFPRPWAWTDELSRYCMVWLAYLAGALGVRYRSHVRIDTLLQLVPARARAGLDMFATLLAFVFGAVITRYGIELCIRNMAQHSASLNLPMGLVYMAIPVGGIFIFIFSIEDVLRLFFKQSYSPKGVEN